MVQEGLTLSTFSDDLRKVPVHLDRKPIASFDGIAAIGPYGQQEIRRRYDENFDPASFAKIAHNLTLSALSRLSLDQLAKIRLSSMYMMSSDVENLFREEPRYVIVNKIQNSMWRWGFRRSGWNELVDAYNGIRGFTMNYPDFEVRLDYTTGHNECGYSEYSRTFLDGVFAFLVYYRGEHVMTLGFSILSGRRILIQQVQLAKRRGNRFLFKLPKNRIEYVIALFRKHFPRHKLFIVDGSDVANKSLKSYRNGLERLQERLARAIASQKKATDLKNAEYHQYDIDHCLEDIPVFEEKITQLEGDVERLAAFYADTGQYDRGKTMSMNGLTHYTLHA